MSTYTHGVISKHHFERSTHFSRDENVKLTPETIYYGMADSNLCCLHPIDFKTENNNKSLSTY